MNETLMERIDRFRKLYPTLPLSKMNEDVETHIVDVIHRQVTWLIDCACEATDDTADIIPDIIEYGNGFLKEIVISNIITVPMFIHETQPNTILPNRTDEKALDMSLFDKVNPVVEYRGFRFKMVAVTVRNIGENDYQCSAKVEFYGFNNEPVKELNNVFDDHRTLRDYIVDM